MRDRVKAPQGNPLFVIYFVSIVVLVAGLGIIITIVRHLTTTFADDTAMIASWKNIFEAAATYSIAISATALADVILSRASAETRAFKAIAIALTVLVGLSFAASFGLPFYGALTGAIVGVLLSLFQWWVINAHNANLDDDPTDPTGGDPMRPLAGTLEGYKV